MKSLQINFSLLKDKVGLDGAVKEVSRIVSNQNVKTYEQLNEAIEEELILMEVD